MDFFLYRTPLFARRSRCRWRGRGILGRIGWSDGVAEPLPLELFKGTGILDGASVLVIASLQGICGSSVHVRVIVDLDWKNRPSISVSEPQMFRLGDLTHWRCTNSKDKSLENDINS